MSTDVRILGWSAEGLRCPDHALDFTAGDGERAKPVTLVQMPNGTGKTTTLQLLRAALSGSAAENVWSEEDVLALKKKNGGEGHARFTVDVGIDQRRISFILDFDFERATVNYRTTLPSGMKEGFHPPREFAPFARENFIRFFIFDGELAEQLISPEHADAARAIDDLFQLDIFAALSNRVEEYWESKVEDRTATEQRGLSRRRNRVRRLRERIDELVAEREKLRDEFEETKTKLERKEERFSDELEEQKDQQRRLLEAQNDLKDAERKVEQATERVVEAIKNPCSFAEVVVRRLQNLKDSLDRVQLPESAAREFFVELSLQDKCVCGRTLDDQSRAAIEERAEQYLGSENVAFLNAMKSRIDDQFQARPERHAERLKKGVDEVREAISEVGQLRTRRDAIEAEAATDDPRLEEARQELKHLREEKEELRHRLAKFEDTTDSGRDEDVQGIAVLRKRLTEAEQDLAEITDTLTLKRKRDVTDRVLEHAHHLARDELSEEICNETNERIRQLMPDNPIRVGEIDRCLVLEGQRSGSTGENLTIAYAFLSTLFNRAEHRLPFIVDSPANPIDLEIRREIGRLVPRLGEQFIAFTISSERNGFLRPLEDSASGVQYLTLFNKENPKVEVEGGVGGRVDETTDGIIVHGREYFRQFQVDEEA